LSLPGQTTLGTLRTTIRQRTDMVNTQFVTDPELNGYINSSIQELYDLLIAAYGEDFSSVLPAFLITTDGLNDKYFLPDGSGTYSLPQPTGGASPVSVIAASPGGATESGNTVTITTTSAHLLVANQLVTIAGVSVAAYNGTFIVTSVPSSTTFTYTNPTSGLAASGNGTAQVTAPAFYKLLGIDHQITGTPGDPRGIYVKMQRFKMAERNQYSFPVWASQWYGNIVIKYHLQNTNPAQLWFIPLPPGGRTIRVFYAARFFPLVNDTDVFDAINGWEEYVVADCALKVLPKEESLEVSSLWTGIKAELKARLIDMAETRDIGTPSTVVDVYTSDYPGYGGYGYGGPGMP